MSASMRVAMVTGLLVGSLGGSLASASPLVPDAVFETHAVAGDAPGIDVRVFGGPVVGTTAITLADELGHRVHPISATPFALGDEPMAVAFVVQGDEVWMGNDDLVPSDDPSCYPGALKGLEKALDALDLPHMLPHGSQVALIAYADKAELRSPLRPVDSFSGSELGSQRDYYNKRGNALVVGVDLAMTELQRSTAPHKLLVVIGDGNDTNNEVAKIALRGQRHVAEAKGIRLGAVIYKDALSDEANVVASLDPTARTIDAADAARTVVRTIVERQTDEVTLRFACDGLACDGLEHQLTLAMAGVELEPERVVLPAVATPSCALSAWWLQLGAGLMLVGALAALSRWRAK